MNHTTRIAALPLRGVLATCAAVSGLRSGCARALLHSLCPPCAGSTMQLIQQCTPIHDRYVDTLHRPQREERGTARGDAGTLKIECLKSSSATTASRRSAGSLWPRCSTFVLVARGPVRARSRSDSGSGTGSGSGADAGADADQPSEPSESVAESDASWGSGSDSEAEESESGSVEPDSPKDERTRATCWTTPATRTAVATGGAASEQPPTEDAPRRWWRPARSPSRTGCARWAWPTPLCRCRGCSTRPTWPRC
eukprot:scaffold7244_cov111-Isochrysis_galbana.AAC.3